MKKIKVMVLLVLCILTAVSGTGKVFAVSYRGFYDWLRDSGIPEYSVSGSYRANYSTYVKYNLVVYGSAADVPGNEFRRGEYRYLGYTYMEGRYTNLDFPNDETGNKPPEQWNFVNVAGAYESWDSLEQTVQRPYMLYTPLNGHGATVLTASDIGTSRAKVQSAASWSSSGSIYTYKSNGFYATFTVPSMGPGMLDAAMTADTSIIYINRTDNRFDAGVTLNASVNKPRNEVAFIKVVFSCGSWSKVRYFHNTNSINIHQDISSDTPASLPGNAVITATVTSESIFGDKLARSVSCNISIIQLSGQNPPTSTPGPNPTPPPSSGTPAPQPSNTPVPTVPPGGGSGNNKLIITSVSITGSWNHWPLQQHRFLALEKVKVKIVVSGRGNSAVIRMSPQLEAMYYTNSAGYTYRYSADFFGHKVRFPRDSTILPIRQSQLSSEFEWEYSLPLCDETLSWENMRKRQSYSMSIVVFGKNGSSCSEEINDIDITGNIFELLYPQPL